MFTSVSSCLRFCPCPCPCPFHVNIDIHVNYPDYVQEQTTCPCNVHAHVNFVVNDPALPMSKQTWKFMNMSASMPKQMYT